MAKENNNKSFVLRIDAATMDALELWAADEFRSINGQLQWIIADALRRSGRLKKPRAAAGATLPAADTGVASSGRDFPPAPAAVSPAVAAAPPADVASGESTPPLQDAVPPVAAAAAGEAGPLPSHARIDGWGILGVYAEFLNVGCGWVRRSVHAPTGLVRH